MAFAITSYIRPLMTAGLAVLPTCSAVAERVAMQLGAHLLFATVAPAPGENRLKPADGSTFLFYFAVQTLLRQIVAIDPNIPLGSIRAPLITTLAVGILGKLFTEDVMNRQISWGYAIAMAFFNRHD